MYPLYKRLLFTFFLFVACLYTCYGQEVKKGLISGDFKEVKFEAFVRQVEAETDYKFFFDKEALDTIVITLQVKEKPLEIVLGQIFKDTDFKYTISSKRFVFITTGVQIFTALPEKFFDPEAIPGADRKMEAISEQYVLSEKRKKGAIQESRLYEVGSRRENASGKANMAGHLKDAESGEPIIGAYIYILSPQIGTASDQYGYYSLTLPVGRHELRVKGIGLKDTKRQIMVYADGKLDIEIEEDVRTLKEVVIEAEKDRNVSGMQMGMEPGYQNY